MTSRPGRHNGIVVDDDYYYSSSTDMPFFSTTGYARPDTQPKEFMCRAGGHPYKTVRSSRPEDYDRPSAILNTPAFIYSPQRQPIRRATADIATRHGHYSRGPYRSRLDSDDYRRQMYVQVQNAARDEPSSRERTHQSHYSEPSDHEDYSPPIIVERQNTRRDRLSSRKRSARDQRYSTRDRPTRDRYARATDSDSGSDYDFRLPLAIRPGSETISQPTSAMAPVTTSPSRQGALYYEASICRVFHSSYTEDDIVGQYTADLTVQEVERKQVTPQAVGMYRWISLQNEVMNFTAFIRDVAMYLQSCGKPSAEIVRKLEDYQARFEKPHSQGLNGRFLDPTLIGPIEIPSQNARDQENSSMMFLCIPFFSLEAYSSRSLPEKSPAHPLRTLLQMRYPSTTKARELQQAICMLKEVPSEVCFHVPQLWCLTIGDNLIFTCARYPTPRLKGDHMTIKTVPDGAGLGPKPILVSDGSGATWILEPDTVQTWLQFTSAFYEIEPAFEEWYDVLWRGMAVQREDWPRILAQTQSSAVSLRIQRRSNPVSVVGTSSDDDSPEASVVDSPLDMSDGEVSADQRSKACPSGDDKGLDEPGDRHATHSPEQFLESKDRLPKTIASYASQEDDLRRRKRRQDFEPDSAIPGPRTGFQEWGSTPMTKDELPDVEKQVKFASKANDAVKDTDMNDPKTQAHIRSWEEPVITQRFDAGRNPANAGVFDFRLLIWLTAEEGENAKTPKLSNTTLDEYMAYLELYLEKKAPKGDRKAYQSCPVTTFESLNLSIRRLQGEVDRRTPKAAGAKERLKFVMLMKKAVSFFMPLQSSQRCVHKCLGALKHMIDVYDTPDDVSMPPVTVLSELHKDIKVIYTNLGTDEAPIHCPFTARDNAVPEFLKAWIDVIMTLIYISTYPEQTGRDEEMLSKKVLRRLTKACGHMEKGFRALRRDIQPTTLDASIAVTPLGVVALLTTNVISDLAERQHNILLTYMTYFRQLALQIRSDALNREHQEKINHFKEEIAAISTVLRGQLSVLEAFDDYLETVHPSEGSLLSQHPERSITTDSIKTVNMRLQDFQVLTDQAADLADENIRLIDANRDRQESAILTFTVVTIIFLPLSFVSSVFGMNTNDIRNMDQTQWAYWAAAVPVTLLVIVLSLAWAGELEWAMSAFTRPWRWKRKAVASAVEPPSYEAATAVDALPIPSSARPERHTSSHSNRVNTGRSSRYAYAPEVVGSRRSRRR